MLRLCLSLATMLLLTTERSYAETKTTGRILFAVGEATPQAEIGDWLEKGDQYRLYLFGGAKLKFGAVGLGWDLTYSNHSIKNSTGSYKRYTWDWFYLPIAVGPVLFTTGLSWVVADVDYPELGIRETSVRPGGIAGLGVRLGIVPNGALSADLRYDNTAKDYETANSGKSYNMQGAFLSAVGGILIYF